MNTYILSRHLKQSVLLVESRVKSGSEFQAIGPVTENTRWPQVLSRKRGMASRWWLVERRCRCISAMETGMQCSNRDTVVRGHSDWWTVTASLKRTGGPIYKISYDNLTINLWRMTNLPNHVTKGARLFLGMIHLQSCKIVWDRVRKLAYNIPKKFYHIVSHYRKSILWWSYDNLTINLRYFVNLAPGWERRANAAGHALSDQGRDETCECRL